MNGSVWRWLILAGWAVVVSSCNPQPRQLAETECSRAIAHVRYTWQVTYYRERTRLNPDPVRIEDFETVTLLTVNGEKPDGADFGPDNYEAWYPKVPPAPTARDIEAARQVSERFNPPQLQRRVRYSLQCSVGELIASGNLYHDLSPLFQQQIPVRVHYGRGQVWRAFLPSGRLLISEEPTQIVATGAFDGKQNTQPDVSSPREGSYISKDVYVDPQAGSDRANGSEYQPFKTITYAIQQAKFGAVIRLKAGRYDTTTGEVFPLRLRPGLALRAYPEDEAVQIIGGGKFLSPTWAGQNVTIVTEKDSRIAGLTITNPNTRGTGIWVESGSPTIGSNRFVKNDREGVFVSGNATPMILQNHFEQNGGNGVSFTRDSRGLMQGNQIRNNGFGVAIGDRAAPYLYRNEIIANQDGIVMNGEAKPELEANTIENNRRDGIVVTNQARPQFKANVLRKNGQYDLHNATGQPLQMPAVNLAELKLKGVQ